MKKLVPTGVVVSAISAVLAAGAALSACSDSGDGDTGTAGDSGTTGGQGRVDATCPPPVPADAAPPPPDASDSGADAGPQLSFSVQASGLVEIFNSFVQARFYEDDLVIRDPSAPDCVAYVRSASKPSSRAGQLALTGEFFGQPGGPATTTLSVAPSDVNTYELFLDNPPQFFPFDQTKTVQVTMEGNEGLPLLPPTTLRSPAFENVAVTEPALDGGTLVVKSNAPFQIRWTAPVSPGAAKMIAALWNVAYVVTGLTKRGELRCEAPIAAGAMTLPASLLGEIRKRANPAAPVAQSYLRLVAGDRRDVRINQPSGGEIASYSVEVASESGTTFGEYQDVTLD